MVFRTAFEKDIWIRLELGQTWMGLFKSGGELPIYGNLDVGKWSQSSPNRTLNLFHRHIWMAWTSSSYLKSVVFVGLFKVLLFAYIQHSYGSRLAQLLMKKYFRWCSKIPELNAFNRKKNILRWGEKINCHVSWPAGNRPLICYNLRYNCPYKYGILHAINEVRST